MAFDSLIQLVSAAVLLAISIAAWVIAGGFKPSVRLNLRFAAMLFAAGAVAAPFAGVGDVAMLVILPPASTALALASLARFTRPAPVAVASLALGASLAAGLGAVVLASAVPAAISSALAAVVAAVAALQDLAWIGAVSAASLLACVFAFLEAGAGAGTLLFGAVALLGLSRSAFAVEQPRQPRLDGFIRGMR